MPQVGGGACVGFAPSPSAQCVVAVGDVQAGALEFDELAFGVEGAMFGGWAGDANFRAECIVGLFCWLRMLVIVAYVDQAIVLNLAAFRDAIATQIVVVFGVVLLGQLALAVPLVVGAAGQAIFGGFQAVFGIPAVASCGTLLALPFAFDQAAVAVVQLALGIAARCAGGFPVLAVESAFDQGVAIHAQGMPTALWVVVVMGGGAVGQVDRFYPATGAVAVGGAVAVLMVFGDLAKGAIDPVQLAVRAAGVGASANGVVAVLAGDGFAVFALAGLGQYPASGVSLCALCPEAGVFTVGDVPGGVVLKPYIAAVGGGATVDVALGVPAQLPLLAIGSGDDSQAFAEIVLVLNLVTIGSAIRQWAHQWAVFVAVLVTLGRGVVGQAASFVIVVLAAAFLIRGLFRVLVYGQQALALVVVLGDQALFQLARYAAIRLVSKALKRAVVSTCQHLPGVGAPQIHSFTAVADSLGGPAFSIVPVLPLAAIGANFAEQTAC